MIALLKTFGKGLLYVIGFPFFIFVLLLFAIYGLLAFLFQLIKSIIFFFTGQKFFPELPEDRELRLRKEGQNKPAQTATAQTQATKAEEIITPLSSDPEPIVVEEVPPMPNPAPNNVEDACFDEPLPVEEPLTNVEEEPISEPLFDVKPDESIEPFADVHEEETVLETADRNDEVQELDEELETYVPRSSNYSATDDDDDDDIAGVNIDYDL